VSIPKADLRKLQRNLILSHAGHVSIPSSTRCRLPGSALAPQHGSRGALHRGSAVW